MLIIFCIVVLIFLFIRKTSELGGPQRQDRTAWQPDSRRQCSSISPCQCCKDTKVLFFPDKKLPCKSFFKQIREEDLRPCRIPNCQFLHGKLNEPKSSLMEVFKILNRAQRQVDLCMYLITQKFMSKFLIHLHKKNVVIRIVTDSGGDEKTKMMNQITELQDAGIRVKTNNQTSTSFRSLMHNKFVIIDNEKVITGSFNWTNTAILNNDEALVITSQRVVVDKFKNKFASMWSNFSNLQRRVELSNDQPKIQGKNWARHSSTTRFGILDKLRTFFGLLTL